MLIHPVSPQAQAETAGAADAVPVREVLPPPNESQEAPIGLDRDYFKGYVTDFVSIVTSPASWDGSDWLTAAAVTGVTVGLYENDAKIQKWALERKTSTTDRIGDAATEVGHGFYTPVLLGGMYLYGHFADDAKMRKTVLLSADSFVLTGVFVQTLKNATGRHRPYTGDGPRAFDGPGLHQPAKLSFPSGHASSAFAVATVIASEYDNIVVPTLAYGVATITALNRVWHNAHWSSDTFVASAIGYFTGKAVVSAHRGGGSSRLGLVPVIEENGAAMILTYQY
jgi:hypothetical protein